MFEKTEHEYQRKIDLKFGRQRDQKKMPKQRERMKRENLIEILCARRRIKERDEAETQNYLQSLRQCIEANPLGFPSEEVEKKEKKKKTRKEKKTKKKKEKKATKKTKQLEIHPAYEIFTLWRVNGLAGDLSELKQKKCCGVKEEARNRQNRGEFQEKMNYLLREINHPLVKFEATITRSLLNEIMLHSVEKIDDRYIEKLRQQWKAEAKSKRKLGAKQAP